MRAFPMHKFVFNRSWDHFQLPYPFRACPIRIGTPYHVTTERLTKEVVAREVERLRQAMASLSRRFREGEKIENEETGGPDEGLAKCIDPHPESVALKNPPIGGEPWKLRRRYVP